MLERCIGAGFEIKPVGTFAHILKLKVQQQIASLPRIVSRSTIGEVAAHVSTGHLVSTELTAARHLPDHSSPFQRPPNTACPQPRSLVVLRCVIRSFQWSSNGPYGHSW